MMSADPAGARDTAPGPGHVDLDIGTVTVRGQGVSLASARRLAIAVAEALAHQISGGTRRIGDMTIRMPGPALDAAGGIDRTALRLAIDRAGSLTDA